MADKTIMQYRVVTNKNPTTGEAMRRATIVNRKTCYIDAIIKRAIDSEYMRGKQDDLKGLVNGFLRTCKTLIEEGVAVTFDSWLRLEARLEGLVGEDRQVTTERNALKVGATALKDLKLSLDSFAWQNVEDTGTQPKIATVAYEGATTAGVIMKGKSIVVTGKNLMFDAEKYGDGIAATWTEDETVKTASLTAATSDYSHMTITDVTALASIPDGTVVTLQFILHAGIAEGAEYTITKPVTFKAA